MDREKTHCIKWITTEPLSESLFQKRDINVKVDLSNHATKLDLNNSLGTDTSKLALKSNLAKKLKWIK